MMRSVLVTRPQPVADEFAEKLRHEGFFVYLAPMTEYVDVAADFSDLAAYQALVFSSAQAVRVFATQSRDRHLPVLAVGDATALTASKAGFGKVFSAMGDSDDVVGLLRVKAGELALKKVLHPCSEDTPGDIGRVAAAFGVEVVRRPVYKSCSLDALPQEVSQALQQGKVDTVTLFSARCATNLVKLMQRKELRGLSAKLEAVCISERVAVELRGIPWRMIHVARQPRMKSMLDVLKEQMGLKRQREMIAEERRARPERRLKEPQRDNSGHIRSHAYTGPDRRAGIDRRAYEQRQREHVLQEKLKFLNNSILGFSLMFIAVVLAGTFLMAPEYAQMGQQRENAAGINWGEKIHRVAMSFTTMAGGLVSSAADAVQNRDPQEFFQLLGNMATESQTPEGLAAVDRSMQTVRRFLGGSPDNPAAIGAALTAERRHDSTLDRLLGSVNGRNLAAGALLLTLNEFRSNVDLSRPYADDLALLQKFAGNDPEMGEALQRLAPYAQKGAMSRQALESEFNSLVSGIVTAKLEGRDVSVKAQALQSFHNLVTLGKLANMKGTAADIVAARAQVRLNQGDVEGALRELKGLDGAAATAAQPWMDNAAGYVATEQSSDVLTQGILSALPGNTGISVESLFARIKDNVGGGTGGGYAGVVP